MVISIINNKGGVGKTMTAQNLGAALALCGKQVCLIDLDSQHNLTTRYENTGREEVKDGELYSNQTIEDYIDNPRLPIRPLKVKDNLYIIPSTTRLARVSAAMYNLSKGQQPSYKLSNICNAMRQGFDYIIVDCAPSMSALMVNAAVAADMIIIPVSCQDALMGAGEGVFELMDNNKLDTPYYFLQTIYEDRLKSNRDRKRQLLSKAFDHTLHTEIKRNEYLNLSAECGQDVYEYAPKSRGAEDYMTLALEVIGITSKRRKE
jgi:chromosome partitioning protein